MADADSLEPVPWTERILRNHGPYAAQIVVDTAKGTQNSRLQLQAACIILDRVLGKVGTGTADDDGFTRLQREIAKANDS
jgi:hypothetical protein